jgi:hypothetical protein
MRRGGENRASIPDTTHDPDGFLSTVLTCGTDNRKIAILVLYLYEHQTPGTGAGLSLWELAVPDLDLIKQEEQGVRDRRAIHEGPVGQSCRSGN